MTYRLKIQTKLLLAFTAVGLLSILVGVFAPLRVITLRGPMKSRELLKNAQLNIFDFYKTWVDEPRLIGEALNANPEFVQAFAAQDRIRVRELLEREARNLGFTFLPEEPPSRLYKYRYLAGVLWSAEEQPPSGTADRRFAAEADFHPARARTAPHNLSCRKHRSDPAGGKDSGRVADRTAHDPKGPLADGQKRILIR